MAWYDEMFDCYAKNAACKDIVSISRRDGVPLAELFVRVAAMPRDASRSGAAELVLSGHLCKQSRGGRYPGAGQFTLDGDFVRKLMVRSEETSDGGEIGLDEYQKSAATTAIYPKGSGLIYTVLGLAGEVGEFCGKVCEEMFSDDNDDPIGSADRCIADVEDRAVISTLDECRRAGEAAERMKKIIRDKKPALSEMFYPRAAVNAIKVRESERFELLLKELGDVLWYVSGVADNLGMKLSKVAGMNLKKLADRAGRNVISGSGDER